PPVARDCVPQTTHTQQDHRPLTIELQDLLDRARQVLDIVALALLAEFPEVGKITPDLGGRHADEAGQLLGGNGSASALDEALQRADIDGEAPDDDIWNIVRIDVIRRLSQSGVAGTACAGYVIRHLPSGPRAESRPVAGTFPSCQAGLAPPACCRQRWAARVPVHKCNRSRAGDAG